MQGAPNGPIARPQFRSDEIAGHAGGELAPADRTGWRAPPALIRTIARAAGWLAGERTGWAGFAEALDQAVRARAALIVETGDVAAVATALGQRVCIVLPADQRCDGLAVLAESLGAATMRTGRGAVPAGAAPVLAVAPGEDGARWALATLAALSLRALPLTTQPAGRRFMWSAGLAHQVAIALGPMRARAGRLIEPAAGAAGLAHFTEALAGALGETGARRSPKRPSARAARPPLPLCLYAGTMAVLALASGPYLLNRLRRGKEERSRLAERRGRPGMARPDGRLVWIHAASVGESVSILPLTTEILRRRWCHTVLITTGTVTSAQIVGRRLPHNVIHQFVPLDAPVFARRFLDHWRPSAAILIESELWPNLVRAVRDRDIALIIANGRMSDTSFSRWRRWPRSAAALGAMVRLVLGQTPLNATRFAMIGAPDVGHTGNLKFDCPAPPFAAADLEAVERQTRMRPVWLAASTHPGEELAVAEAHIAVRDRFPDLLTIIVPRHPERGPAIVRELEARWLVAARRTAGEIADAKTDVYVADTIGELGLFYRLAGIALVGGSLAQIGGHNPIEPALLDCAILHGPHVGNFRDMYEAFDEAGGASEVADAAELSRHLGDLLGNAERRAGMVAANRGEIARNAGSLERTLTALEPLLAR